MKQVHSKKINRMTDETPDNSHRLTATNIGIDIGTIVSEKPRLQSSHW